MVCKKNEMNAEGRLWRRGGGGAEAEAEEGERCVGEGWLSCWSVLERP